jgi:mono/diheme cytochrome c family protein
VRRGAVLPALLLLLTSCRDGPVPAGDGDVQRVEAGRRVYERKCASCHGSLGDGNTVTASKFPYANLVDGVWRSEGTAEVIERQIREGRDPMPKFEGKLTDEEIRQTVSFILELSRKGAP